MTFTPARLAAALIVIAALAPNVASAQVIVEGIAAVVNEDIILLSKLRERAQPIAMEAARKSLAQELTPELEKQAFRRALSDMIDDILIKEQAAKMRIRVSSVEVDRAIKNVARQNDLSWEQFIVAVEKQGLGLTQYRRELRRQLQRFKVVQAKLQGRLRVSDREIETYYHRQVRGAREGDRARVAHILVKVEPSSGAATTAQRRRKAEAIVARAEEGAPFGALAKRYSDDTLSKSRGGALGWIESIELPEELRDTVLTLDAGAVSGPIRTAKGFHIVKVLEWEASEVRPLDARVREEIRLRLIEDQMQHQERLWLADLRRKAYIDVRLRP